MRHGALGSVGKRLMLMRRRTRERREQSTAKKFTCGTLHGKQGSDEPPEANLHLSKPSCNIVASHSGPDSGVAVYKQFAQGRHFEPTCALSSWGAVDSFGAVMSEASEPHT